MVERPVSGPDEADEVDLQEWNRLLEERVRALEQQMQENPQSGAGMSPPPLYGPDGSITGQHSPAPVQKADYQRPAGSTDRLPVKAISLQQVKRNASGWTSASQ